MDLNVFETEDETRLLAICEDDKGWVWDRRFSEGDVKAETQYETNIPELEYGILDGVNESYLNSGSLDFRFKRLVTKKYECSLVSPVYGTGEYGYKTENAPLFSDYSVQGKVQNYTDDFGTLHEGAYGLHEDAITGSLDIRIYMHDGAEVRTYKKYVWTDNFTGVISESGHSREDPVDGSNIDWSEVDTTRPEYMIIDGRVQLNNEEPIKIGDPDGEYGISENEVQGYWESKGAGTLTGRKFLTNLFPIVDGSVRVVSISLSGVVTEWTEVRHILEASPTEKAFAVDYDAGFIEIGGFEYESIYSSHATGIAVPAAYVHGAPHLSIIKTPFLIQMDSEEILVRESRFSMLSGLARGMNGTTAAIHPAHTEVVFGPYGVGSEDKFFISYKVAPKIEFEITDSVERTAYGSKWLDLSTLRMREKHGLVVINRNVPMLFSLSLEMSAAQRVSENQYELTMNSSNSYFLIKAKDIAGSPLQGIEVSIVTSSEGLVLNGASSYAGVTSNYGEAYVTVVAPIENPLLSNRAVSVVHSGADTAITYEIPPSGSAANMVTYAILKHDPFYGSDGLPFEVISSGVPSDPALGQGYLTIDGILDETYENGFIMYEDSGTIYTNSIKTFELDTSSPGNPTLVYLKDSDIPAPGTITKFFRAEDPTYTSADKAVQAVLFEGVSGAYTRVVPSLIIGAVATYQNVHLPIPSSNNNVAGYTSATEGTISVYALGRDEYSSAPVSTSFIYVNLKIPDYLNSTSSDGAVLDEHGLAGNVYLTYNPAAQGFTFVNTLTV